MDIQYPENQDDQASSNSIHEQQEKVDYTTAIQLFDQIKTEGLDENGVQMVKELEDRLRIIAQLDQQENDIEKKKLNQIKQLNQQFNSFNNSKSNSNNQQQNFNLSASRLGDRNDQKNNLTNKNLTNYQGQSSPKKLESDKYQRSATALKISRIQNDNATINTNKKHSTSVKEEMKCTFQPSINNKSKKLARRGDGEKDYSVKYLYEDFLQRKEKETQKKQELEAQTEEKMTRSKIDSKSQKIILSKIDRALSAMIENVQEGEYLSYESLGMLYCEVSLFRAIQFEKDQNQTSLYLNNRKKIDLTRLEAEMKFHEQSHRILSVTSPDEGVPKKLAFDFLMVLFETKIQPWQTEQILKDILFGQLGLDQNNTTAEEKEAVLKEILSQSTLTQDSLSSNENWDITTFVSNFRKLHDDKTSLMEWYASKNANILGENSSGKQKIQSELKFKPEINKKSKILDQYLSQSRDMNKGEQAFGNNNNASQSQIQNKSRFELLYEHSKFLEMKKKEQQEQIIREKQSQCTFKPTINQKKGMEEMNESVKRSPEQEGNGDSTIHQKLYSRHSKKSEILAEMRSNAESQKEKQALLECTFKPNINYSQYWVAQQQEQETNIENIKGVSMQIMRLEKARIIQQEKDSFFERQRMNLSQNYSRFTETMPFSFDQNNNNSRLQNSSQFSSANQKFKKDREIIGNVDVNFSKGKKGRIIIYKGDSADELAFNFAKIYSLNDEMKITLKEMLQNYINKIIEEENDSNLKLSQASQTLASNEQAQQGQQSQQQSTSNEQKEAGTGQHQNVESKEEIDPHLIEENQEEDDEEQNNQEQLQQEQQEEDREVEEGNQHEEVEEDYDENQRNSQEICNELVGDTIAM